MTENFQVIDGVLAAYSGSRPDLTLPAGVRAVAAGCFSGCDTLRSAALPPGLSELGEESFADCPALERVVLPPGLAAVGPSAFAYCAALREVSLPAGLAEIEGCAFLGCAALREIELPATLKIIGDAAFSESGLEHVRVPAGVEAVGDLAFRECASLAGAWIPNAATRLGKDVFSCCYRLREGYIAPGYPPDPNPEEALIYTLLWCGCAERHGARTGRRARDFIRDNEALVLDWIFKNDAVPALNGLAHLGLLSKAGIDVALRRATDERRADFTALLLEAGRGSAAGWPSEFEL